MLYQGDGSMKYPLLSLFISILAGLGLSVSAAEISTEEQMESLEKRFFQHTFKKDSDQARLTRLEKFTFGDTNQGTVEGRLSKINQVVEKSAVPSPGEAQPTTAKAPRTAKSSNAGSIGDYPHITFLEDELLTQEYKDEPIEQRLTRLEKHTFGRASSSEDLQQRTDALEHYAVATLHKRPFIKDKINEHRSIRARPPIASSFPLGFSTPKPEDLAAAQDSPPPPHSRLLSRIAWCEKHTLGRTYPELHLLDRLHQLNSHLFPEDHEKDIRLMDRVDDMVKKVVLVQHPPQTAYSAPAR